MIELKNSIYFDVPKTGGSWVSEGLVQYMNGKFELGSSHQPPKGKYKKFTFTFIRHPVDWHRSYYASMGDEMTFNEFIKYAYSGKAKFFTGKPWTSYSDYLKPFLECDFVGKTESLKEDLGKAIIMSGEEFDEGNLMDRSKINVAKRKIDVDDESRELIEKKEKYIIDKYYDLSNHAQC